MPFFEDSSQDYHRTELTEENTTIVYFTVKYFFIGNMLKISFLFQVRKIAFWLLASADPGRTQLSNS